MMAAMELMAALVGGAALPLFVIWHMTRHGQRMTLGQLKWFTFLLFAGGFLLGFFALALLFAALKCLGIFQ